MSLPLFALEEEMEIVEGVEFLVSEEIATLEDRATVMALQTFRHALLTDPAAIPGWSVVSPLRCWRAREVRLMAERRDHRASTTPCAQCGRTHHGVVAIVRFRRAADSE